MAVLNKHWKQDLAKLSLHGHLPPISQKHPAENCLRSKDKPMNDVLLQTSTQGHATACQLAKSYINQLCADTRNSLEDRQRVAQSTGAVEYTDCIFKEE